MEPLTLGTAGHIDHGKTALVRALTGVDTDRLPEEKARGISIALGYAPLALPSGRRLSVVDVPGHERFVRTMVAGATGIDLYLMVVAADDGVMPQTREHAAVLAALGVTAGVVAVTKADLAEPELAGAEAAELLPEAEVVPVSSRTGAGLDALRAALDRVAATLPGRGGTGGELRLHVDRGFTIRGAGTVVTGTLWSGTVGRGDTVTLLPAGLRARVRAVQVHDEPVERAGAGQRVAVNLTGVERAAVTRGDLLAGGEPLPVPAHRLDVALRWASPDARPDGGARVAVHHGTREAPARLAELGGRFFQLRLEQPLVADRGDRVVIRALAPPDTLGGGVILDPAPRRHGPSRDLLARLERLERGEADPRPEGDVPGERVRVRDGGSRAPATARRGRAGVPAPAAGPSDPGRPSLGDAALALERRLLEAGHEPPADAELDPAGLADLRDHGRAVRLGASMHIHPESLAAVRDRFVAMAERDGEVTLAGFRDELGTSRRYAQALLEHFDAEKLTLRVGDARRLRRRARAS